MTDIGDAIRRIERSRYPLLALKHVGEHLEDYRESIAGEYDGERPKWQTAPGRRFEPPDLTWDGIGSVTDLRDAIVRSLAVMRLVSIKAAADDLATSLSDGPRRFYDDLKRRCPGVVLTMPDGEVMHMVDLVKLLRDELAHRGRDDQHQRRLLELAGSADPADFLTRTVLTSTDGEEVKCITYGDRIECGGTSVSMVTMVDVITSEYISMLMMYGHLLGNDGETEGDCVGRNWWRPYRYVGELPPLSERDP